VESRHREAENSKKPEDKIDEGYIPVAAKRLLVVELPGGAAGGAALGVEVSLALEPAVLPAG
jgi:hypothetical protein